VSVKKTDVPIEFINTTIRPCDCTSCDVLEQHTDPQLRRLTCLLSLSIRQLGHVIALVVMSPNCRIDKLNRHVSRLN
jgi:hypothetical protein